MNMAAIVFTYFLTEILAQFCKETQQLPL